MSGMRRVSRCAGIQFGPSKAIFEMTTCPVGAAPSSKTSDATRDGNAPMTVSTVIEAIAARSADRRMMVPLEGYMTWRDRRGELDDQRSVIRHSWKDGRLRLRLIRRLLLIHLDCSKDGRRI